MSWVVSEVKGRKIVDTDIPPDGWCTVILVADGKSEVLHIPEDSKLKSLLQQLYGAQIAEDLLESNGVKILSGRGLSFERPSVWTPLRDRDLLRVNPELLKNLKLAAARAEKDVE